MQTYALKKRVVIKATAGQPLAEGKPAIRRTRLVTVAEGLTFGEAKARRAGEKGLEIVPERSGSPERSARAELVLGGPEGG